MRKSKKMKPGKLSGPSHKNGGILLEAEGGEYIIKKSSVKKIGKTKLDKINKEGKIPMAKVKKKFLGGVTRKMREEIKPRGGTAKKGGAIPKKYIGGMLKPPIRPKEDWKKGGSVDKKKHGGKLGKKTGDPIKTYSSGGYVEGK